MPYPPFFKTFKPLRLRQTPDVFAVEHLRAIPGRGAFPKDNAGSVGKRWVVVTGLVLYKKQLEEFRSKFLTAASSDPVQDVPKYLGFYIQKAEVVPGAKEEPKWSKPVYVGAKEMTDAINRVSGKTQVEPADPRFIRPQLASPLPLLADVSRGNEAVYPPQIPVVEHAAAAGAEGAAAGAGGLGVQNPPAGGQLPVRGRPDAGPGPIPPVVGSGLLGPATIRRAADRQEPKIPAPSTIRKRRSTCSCAISTLTSSPTNSINIGSSPCL